jgi:hypothetical protein
MLINPPIKVSTLIGSDKNKYAIDIDISGTENINTLTFFGPSTGVR